MFSKGKEVADDLRERWETSDSPLVHRIQVGNLHIDSARHMMYSVERKPSHVTSMCQCMSQPRQEQCAISGAPQLQVLPVSYAGI